MANNTKEIKRRIKAVKNIGQITKAQQMVSAVKMKKAQDSLKKVDSYFSIMDNIFNTLLIDIGESDLREIMKKTNKKDSNIGLVIIAPTRGLAGSLISNLTKKTLEFVLKREKNMSYDNEEFIVFKHNAEEEIKESIDKLNINLITVEKKSKTVTSNLQKDIIADFPTLSNPPVFEDALPISSILMEKYNTGEISEIFIVYSHFISTFSQKAVIKKILPFDIEKAYKRIKDMDIKKAWYTYSTKKDKFFKKFLPVYIDTLIYHAIIDSLAAEHSARMIAMKNATDNAVELKKELTFEYNQKRQANITQEIAEITSASENI